MVKHSLILSAPLLVLAACSNESQSFRELGTTSQSLSQVLQDEEESNNTPATATPLSIDGNGAALVRGALTPTADADLYSFSASMNDRIYAGTMTSWATPSQDSLLELLASDGTTVIESDDDDGVFAQFSSSISGATITGAGSATYYLRVKPFTSGVINPYDLHFQLRSGSPTAETEPNGNGSSFQNLPTSKWVSGALADAADVDGFIISASAGDTITASLDLDPERDGGWDGQLNLQSFGSTPGSIVANNNATVSAPLSEALYVTVNETGDYAVTVGAAASAFGTYQLSVTVDPKASTPSGSTCTQYTSTDIPKVIPSGPGAITSELTVPNGAGRVGWMEVGLNIDHDRMADLDVDLIAPDGNQVGLFEAIGSTVALTQTTMTVVIDESAATPINALGSTLTKLRAQPTSHHRLTWFNGQAATGTWTLNVNDTTGSNAGTLQGWSIRVCTMPALSNSCPANTARTTLLSTDFEDDDGGFTHTGTADEWELGTPSLAPIDSCASGTECWKTDLDGTYTVSSTADLVSPTIDLSNAAGSVNVTWMQKSNIEPNYDKATVAIRRANNADPSTLWEWQNGTATTAPIETAGWGLHATTASGYAGQDVELVFNLTADTTTNYSGLAIDDVIVTACVYVCGDGNALGTEECDDGNTDNGDGCDENCQDEVAVPDAGGTDGGLATDGGSDSGAGGNAGNSAGGNGGTPANGDDAGNAGGANGGSAGTGGTMERPPVDFPDTAGTGGNAGASTGPGANTKEDSGCGCKLAGQSSPQQPWSGLALTALFATAAIRRRRRS
jgi:cysteine-rich repeat protein